MSDLYSQKMYEDFQSFTSLVETCRFMVRAVDESRLFVIQTNCDHNPVMKLPDDTQMVLTMWISASPSDWLPKGVWEFPAELLAIQRIKELQKRYV